MLATRAVSRVSPPKRASGCRAVEGRLLVAVEVCSRPGRPSARLHSAEGPEPCRMLVPVRVRQASTVRDSPVTKLGEADESRSVR